VLIAFILVTLNVKMLYDVASSSLGG
jgi:hypothetical protein